MLKGTLSAATLERRALIILFFLWKTIIPSRSQDSNHWPTSVCLRPLKGKLTHLPGEISLYPDGFNVICQNWVSTQTMELKCTNEKLNSNVIIPQIVTSLSRFLLCRNTQFVGPFSRLIHLQIVHSKVCRSQWVTMWRLLTKQRNISTFLWQTYLDLSKWHWRCWMDLLFMWFGESIR